MTELKLYRPRFMPVGTVWGVLAASFIIPFVAANDDSAPFPVDPAAPPVLLLAPPQPKPKLRLV